MVLSALAEQPVSVRPADDLAERILTYCLGRLSDPRLSPESVARAHHVSVRYLHKVLQQRGVTLASWIRGRRLERIRRDLADPALADRSVSVIAARWGLLDATHLSRTLRARSSGRARPKSARLRVAGPVPGARTVPRRADAPARSPVVAGMTAGQAHRWATTPVSEVETRVYPTRAPP
ncbi:helix-turn-helix domain-containing protein [Streptomyces sp. V4I2]|uniref:helix-turn-helix domain-containing protein n=1 Tax=Streptomyces sp. V4I2 TaxID=3042280 RepID=UPI00278B718C|nr:helix-turn-helix domain-containing protein [Streptomyces sp. V4I2]MDQ1046303.1 AraC-like DNA-binding protein [Streptomyces sp. V4I2]